MATTTSNEIIDELSNDVSRHDKSRAPAIVGAAAAGLMAGLAANFVRKAVTQAPTAVAGDWMGGLKAEHLATLAIFDKIEQTGAQHMARRKLLLIQLKHALGKHAFQEENVVYPALRDHGQTEGADALNHDHGYVKQYLFDLTEMPADSPQWLEKVRSFRADVEKHIRHEEDELFPRLHDALGEKGNAHITRAMNIEGLKIA
ncbi:MAG TPA: hemerythrin domain-containing protein [Sphingomonadaceae bacterium]|nr:hemerythrin domain-containing protein [Sphingomonadaceae bacterium]